MITAAGPLVLDSGAATVTIDPLLGGRVVSFRDERGEELLAPGRPPAGRIRPGDPFVAGGLGGIDDCLPGISAEIVDGPVRRSVSDHGEIWSRPAHVERLTRTSVTLLQVGSADDFALHRTLSLDSAALSVEYTLASRCKTPLAVVWSAHPLLPLSSDVELDLGPIESLRVFSGTLAPPGADLDPRRVPVGGSIIDLTRPGTIPVGHCLKAFAPLPRGADVGASYPARGTRIVQALRAERDAWLGVWLNANGFPADAPVSHLALEPSFGHSDTLSDAIAAGTCLVVDPDEAFTWTLTYEAHPL